MTEYTQDEILENRRRWIQALRSGEYPRTTGVLHRIVDIEYSPVGFCCLGVAMELFHEGPTENRGTEMAYISPDGLHVEDTSLSQEVADKLGLTNSCPKVDIQGKSISLITLNDSGYSSFAGIAKAIEDQPTDWDGSHNPGDGYWVDEELKNELPGEYR